MSDELIELDATAQADLVRRGEVASAEMEPDAATGDEAESRAADRCKPSQSVIRTPSISEITLTRGQG